MLRVSLEIFLKTYNLGVVYPWNVPGLSEKTLANALAHMAIRSECLKFIFDPTNYLNDPLIHTVGI